MFFREPSKKQIKELAKAKSESQNKSFSSLQKKMHSLNSQLNEIKSSLINKKALNWEDKSSLENFLKDQKKLQNDLNNNYFDNEIIYFFVVFNYFCEF